MFMSNIGVVIASASTISAACRKRNNIVSDKKKWCPNCGEDINHHLEIVADEFKECYCGDKIDNDKKTCGKKECIVRYKTHFYIQNGYDSHE